MNNTENQNISLLDFEAPIGELQNKIDELHNIQDGENELLDSIEKLLQKRNNLIEKIYQNLTAWQISQVARHPQRPYTLDYIKLIFDDFEELHGDRHFADDHAIIGGIATLNDYSVIVIGHQKGRTTKDKIFRNFGMPRPEGYRKALRLMKLAEKFQFPIITFIDTPGAYPGIDAEERGQSEAIGRNLYEMPTLKVPLIATVIGEGGSGGALAIAVGDVVQMLEYSTYSVISPEGCASILWKDASNADKAAETMGITAQRLYDLQLIDNIVAEPVGGAHRNHAEMAKNLKQSLLTHLQNLAKIDSEELIKRRFERIMAYGKFYN